MDAKSLRIVYMGTPDFAVTPLRALVENSYNVVAVITSPDKPAGRGLKIQESAVKQYAVQAGLCVLQPEKLRDPEFLRELKALDPDLGIVIAFRMLPEVVWAMPKLGTFNLHASLLPQYRGAAPIHWAVINGETETGVTTFMLNAEIDQGAVIGQRKIPITETDTTGTLHDKLMHLGTELVLESVNLLACGEARPVAQEGIEAGELKEAPKIFKETGRIDWNAPVEKSYNLIRGLSPYPAAWCEMTGPNGEQIAVKIYSVRKERTAHAHTLGTLLSDGKTTLKVACPDGYIEIDELQAAGKKRMPAADFLRGFDTKGWRFE
jgi:methionyl-tRNA formyltransferase